MTPEPSNEYQKLVEALEPLRPLFDKAMSPNKLEWYLPWRVIPSGGKPIIAGSKSGNLFRGFIGTWKDADLIVATINALPAVFSALANLPHAAEEAANG